LANGGDQAGAEYCVAAVRRGAVTVHTISDAAVNETKCKMPARCLPTGRQADATLTGFEDSAMQIILQEDVEKLGTRGELVEVAEGYARNFLLPRKLGLEATVGNLKRLEKMRANFAKKEATETEAAQKQAEQLAAVSLEFTRKAGENDQLFGSVTSGDVAEALAAKGFEIDKKRIVLAEPIKIMGEYEIPVKLHREVTQNVKLSVKKEE
jgi:large subunit ribosomal protein L9